MFYFFLSLPSLFSGLSHKLFLLSFLFSLSIFAGHLIIIHLGLIFLGLEADGVLLLPLLFLYLTALIKGAFERFTAEFIKIQNSRVSHTSQDLSFSGFCTANIRFFLPVESHELNAKVRWKLIELLSFFENSISLENLGELLLFTF